MCMYTCIYLHISSTQVYICKYVFDHIFNCVLVHTHVSYACISIHVCVYTCGHIHVCEYVCVCITHIKQEEIHNRCFICVCSALQVDFMLIKV